MPSPSDRARDRDRDAAIRTLDQAVSDRRIIPADRDLRVAAIRQARTLQDIAMQVGGLDTPAPPSSPAPSAPAGPAGPALYGPPVGQGFSGAASTVASGLLRGLGRRLIGVAIAMTLVVVAVPVILLVAVLSNDSSDSGVDFPESSAPDPNADASYAPGDTPIDGVNLLTVDAYAAMLRGLQGQAGTTVVYQAVVRDSYAVLDVADVADVAGDPASGSFTNYLYDGSTFTHVTNYDGTATAQKPIDLADVDPQLLIDTLGVLIGRISAASQWSCEADSPTGGQPQVVCEAHNHDGANTTRTVGLDGTVRNDSPATSVSPDASASPGG